MIQWNKIEWRKRDKNLPRCDGRYLCRCIIPETTGGYSTDIRTLWFSEYPSQYFSIDGMIVTHWAELPNMPEDV